MATHDFEIEIEVDIRVPVWAKWSAVTLVHVAGWLVNFAGWLVTRSIRVK